MFILLGVSGLEVMVACFGKCFVCMGTVCLWSWSKSGKAKGLEIGRIREAAKEKAKQNGENIITITTGWTVNLN